MTNSYEPCTRIDQFCGAFTIVGHNFAIDYSAHVFFCICSYDQTYAVDSILYSPRCKVNSSPIGVGVTCKKRKIECTERQLIFPPSLKSCQFLDQRIISRRNIKKSNLLQHENVHTN